MLLSEAFVLSEAYRPDLRQKYERFSVLLFELVSCPVPFIMSLLCVPYMKVCFSHQTVGGPRSSAARSTVLITAVAG